jgi:hypothetical protein
VSNLTDYVDSTNRTYVDPLVSGVSGTINPWLYWGIDLADQWFVEPFDRRRRPPTTTTTTHTHSATSTATATSTGTGTATSTQSSEDPSTVPTTATTTHTHTATATATATAVYQIPSNRDDINMSIDVTGDRNDVKSAEI